MNNQEKYELERQFTEFSRKVGNPAFSFSGGAINRLIEWVSCGIVKHAPKPSNFGESQKKLQQIIRDNERHNDYKTHT